MSMLVINANLQHIEVIQRIVYETWPVAYGNIISAAQITYMLEKVYDTTVLTQQIQGGHQFLLAQNNNGEFVGFAGIGREPMEAMYKLHKLYVLPTAQGTGAGKALLQAACELAKFQGGEQIILQVNRQNPAVGFYQQQGFTILYEQDLPIGEGYFMNDYVMGKAL